MYQIHINRLAVKEIKQLPHEIILKVHDKITSLAQNPRPQGVVKLITFDNLWRVRVGNYRIIYAIDDKEAVIDILRVINRKDAYR